MTVGHGPFTTVGINGSTSAPERPTSKCAVVGCQIWAVSIAIDTTDTMTVTIIAV